MQCKRVILTPAYDNYERCLKEIWWSKLTIKSTCIRLQEKMELSCGRGQSKWSKCTLADKVLIRVWGENLNQVDINMAFRGEGNICTMKFANWAALSLISVDCYAKEAFWQKEYSFQGKCITMVKFIKGGISPFQGQENLSLLTFWWHLRPWWPPNSLNNLRY